MLPLAMLALVASAPQLVVSTSSSCPSARAVAEQLTLLRIPSGGTTVLTHRLEVERDPNALRVRLLDASGRIIAQRALPADNRCADLAAAVAVATSAWLMQLRGTVLDTPQVSEPGEPRSAVEAAPIEVDTATAAEEAPREAPRLGLGLDDPERAWSVALRASGTQVSHPEAATIGVYSLRLARPLGTHQAIELRLPLSSITFDRSLAGTILQLGNPTLIVKHRFALFELAGGRTALALRARLGVPLFIPNSVAQLSTAEYDFADIYNFLPDRVDLGGGAVASWQGSLLRFGAQIDGDVFINSSANYSLLGALTYGLSASLWPLGDWVGVCAEARGAAFFGADVRNELFAYFGLRAELFQLARPAVWISLPLGLVRDLTPFQLQGELRFDLPW